MYFSCWRFSKDYAPFQFCNFVTYVSLVVMLEGAISGFFGDVNCVTWVLVLIWINLMNDIWYEYNCLFFLGMRNESVYVQKQTSI